jgi:hypothetical protein
MRATAKEEEEMSTEQRRIGMAVQKGPMVYVYDEKNCQIFSMAAGNGPDDGLKGYTPSRVNIKRGRVMYSYNERGLNVSTMPVG